MMNSALTTATPSRDVDRSTLAGLIDQFAADEALANQDSVTKLAKIRMTAVGTVRAPGLNGEFALTDHARAQLARLLGVSWDKWFAGAGPRDQAEEVNRRLARAEGVVRIRSLKKPEDECDDATDGVVRAFVSPTYSPISDLAIAQVVREALVNVEPNPRMVRADLTDLTSSYVVRLGKPFRVGGDGEVGDVWGGLLVRNSGVGFTKLSVTLSLTRLACMNGLVLPVPDASIVRWVHHKLDIGKIRERIVTGLGGVTEKLHRGARVLEASTQHRVDNIDDHVRDVLREARLPLRLVAAVLAAYAREPRASRFGVSQAVTLAAQSESPETRYEMERAAGRYLRSGA
jgi:hypothetical protein